MIPLRVQAGSIFLSFFIGFFSFMLYDFFNRLFYHQQGKFIRLVFELSFFSSIAIIYYVLLCMVCNGKYNAFYFAFLGVGIFIYYKFYRINFLRKYEELAFLYKKFFLIKYRKKKRLFFSKLKSKLKKKDQKPKANKRKGLKRKKNIKKVQESIE